MNKLGFLNLTIPEMALEKNFKSSNKPRLKKRTPNQYLSDEINSKVLKMKKRNALFPSFYSSEMMESGYTLAKRQSNKEILYKEGVIVT